MRKFLIAVSIGHFLLLPFYVKLGAIIPWRASNQIFGDTPTIVVIFISAALAPFMIAGVLLLGDGLLARIVPQQTAAKLKQCIIICLGFLASLSFINAILLADNALYEERLKIVAFLSSHPVTLIVIPGVLLAVFTIVWINAHLRSIAAKSITSVLFLTSLTAFLTVSSVLYLLGAQFYQTKESYGELPLVNEPELKEGLPENIVFLLLDDFSYTALFSDSKVLDQYPNLKELASESVVFHNTSTSLPGGTVRNVPAILLGLVIHKEGDSIPDQVDYLDTLRTPELPTSSTNLFHFVQQQGYTPIILGTFLRYCSTYGTGNGFCLSNAWALNNGNLPLPLAFLEPYRITTFLDIPRVINLKLNKSIGKLTFNFFDDSPNLWSNKLHAQVLETLDTSSGFFLWAHYPVPHAPYVSYDPESGKLEPASSYLDGVAAADHLVGDIKATLEASNKWDSTMLIILSDHFHDGFPDDDRRIPFIFKLPYSNVHYDSSQPLINADLFPIIENLFSTGRFNPDGLLEAAGTSKARVEFPESGLP